MISYLCNLFCVFDQIPSESLSGIDVSVALSTLQNGMLCYDPIPAEFLRTVHDTPQVNFTLAI